MGILKDAEKYEEWFGRNGNIFESEALAIESLIPSDIDMSDSLDVGCGTGLFTVRLGIRHGVEASKQMARLCRAKGVDVMIVSADDMPYDDEQFSIAFLLGVLCYINKDHRLSLLKEIYRVLKPMGYVVVAFLQRSVGFADLYERAVSQGRYPADEVPETPYPIEFIKEIPGFLSYDEVVDLLHLSGFTDLYTVKTLTRAPKYANKALEMPSPGYEGGSWVVVRGRKKIRFKPST